MDQFQLLSLVTILIVIVILLAFMWLIGTSGRLNLDKINLEDDQFCSCPGNCSYGHSCHRLLGTN